MGALDGIRIIDFGQYIAGPLAGMLLADQGADVIRIDPSEGPFWNTPANATWNRGKRSLILNLKNENDIKVAKKLIQNADVVIENFRPGVMKRLGLDAESMITDNPNLIYCSMPGFASDDPRNTLQAWEGIIAAAAGSYRPSPGSASPRPVYTAVPIASCYAAFQSVVSIGMALIARERDGHGQSIEVPLFDSMFPAMGARVLTMHDTPAAPPTRNLTWTRQYQCKDDRWIQFHSGNLNFKDFLELNNASGWAMEKNFTEEEIQQRIESLFLSKTSSEWEDLVATIGSETVICRTSSEWINHHHAQSSQMIAKVEDPQLGTMLQPGINVRMSKTPGLINSGAPIPGQHQKEVLSEIEILSEPPVMNTKKIMRSALEGVKVLDLCIVLAGPTCGRTLGEFGADVIKIDSPSRERVVFHNDINRAKRSIIIDLKTNEGLDVFWKLVSTADVIVQNLRKGVTERLGIGYEQVKLRKPDIIYASLNTYGHEGPWAERPGHEQLAQAATGMQERYGGDDRPVLQPYAINDYGTGFMGAYGVALALHHRNRTGEGQHIDSALTYTACTLQSQFFQEYDGKQWDEPRGQNILGTNPLNRAYQTSDGWLFMSTSNSSLSAIGEIPGLQSTKGKIDIELEQALEINIKEASTNHWVHLLGKSGIASHQVIFNPQELLTDKWVIEHGLSVTRLHDDLGRITTTGPAPRLSLSPVDVGRPAPRPGSDAKEILFEIGMENIYDQLVEQNIIYTKGITAG